MTAASATDPWAAQRRRQKREADARRRFHEERRRRDREAACRTACDCGWEFVGTAEQGIQAARDHRAAEHPDRPTRTPNLRRKSQPASPATAAATGTRERNREAVLRAVEQLGAVWATTTQVAEAAGITPHEAGRLLVAEGLGRTRRRLGDRYYWLGPDEPPSRRRVCAAPGCDVEFTPNSGSQKFHSTACRDASYRLR